MLSTLTPLLGTAFRAVILVIFFIFWPREEINCRRLLHLRGHPRGESLVVVGHHVGGDGVPLLVGHPSRRGRQLVGPGLALHGGAGCGTLLPLASLEKFGLLGSRLLRGSTSRGIG